MLEGWDALLGTRRPSQDPPERKKSRSRPSFPDCGRIHFLLSGKVSRWINLGPPICAAIFPTRPIPKPTAAPTASASAAPAAAGTAAEAAVNPRSKTRTGGLFAAQMHRQLLRIRVGALFFMSLSLMRGATCNKSPASPEKDVLP